MPDPTIAGTAAIVLILDPGTYSWCACGLSKSQPFCDGSHEGTPFQPLDFTITESKRCALCTCKRTHNAPMCDSTHKYLPQ